MSTNVPGQPEYLGSGSPEPAPADGSERRRRGLRGGVVGAVVVGVVAAVGAGAYGVVSLMSGGSSPASAVPADAVAYASLDLDPSAAQKIEAIKILRRFPGIRSELHLGSRDDLRKRVLEEVTQEGDCKGLDYADDVEPWIGDRVAVAGVPGQGNEVLPLVVLQVEDQAEAEAGIGKLECSRDDSVAVAFSGDYMLLTEKQTDADAMAKAVDSAALEDDQDFTTWMDRTGDAGIVTMYAAKGAPAAIAAAQSVHGAAAERQAAQLEKALADFDGAAGVLRFQDGAVELELSAKGLARGVSGGKAVTDAGSLPGTTAALLSVAFEDGWLDSSLAQVKEAVGASELDDAMAQAEARTGLRLPEDIETLLGRGVSISVDASADLEALAESPDPSKVPAGIRITGDAAKITAIVEKLKAAAGPGGRIVEVRSKGDVVSVGLDADYVESLLHNGDLGSSAAFRRVVPEADRAGGVLFVNFDAGKGWAEELADLLSDGDREVTENIAPLDALGASSWQDDQQVQHLRARLTTD
jgi:hypothetical protein